VIYSLKNFQENHYTTLYYYQILKGSVTVLQRKYDTQSLEKPYNHKKQCK